MTRGRPKKPRNIQREPVVTQFSPRGPVGRPGHVELGLDEFEALRLADFINLRQAEAARSMGISQQTYSRVLKRARKRLIEGLVLGKIINITKDLKSKSKSRKKRAEIHQNPGPTTSISKLV